MSLNLSLYTVSAVLILDNEGSRLYAKYYNSPSIESSNSTSHTTTTNNTNTNNNNNINSDPYFSTLQQQLKFEKSLFSKVNKVNQDIVLYDNHLITYKQTNDIILLIVAKINENESLIYSIMANLFESLNILLDNTIDKATILEKYDIVTLTIDETIDDGIIIESDPAIIVSRVTNAPAAQLDGVHVNIDKGLFDAFSFASKKISERLQQGL
ncbi:golgi-to-ER vesicle coat component [Scheffersomyces amazonensis]|uniref:golgi-to-ER vesicle coat component n=1 Tax=Scheffersomyces amazonensis TaxID=1078765 RepID=UPI00315DBC2F